MTPYMIAPKLRRLVTTVSFGAVLLLNAGIPQIASGASPARDSARSAQTATAAATALALGYEHTCVVNTSGTLTCWGDNSRSQLTRSFVPQNQTLVPVELSTLTGVTAIAAGDYHTCIMIGSPAKVQCWGASLYGQTAYDAPPGPAPYGRINGVEQIRSVPETSSTRRLPHDVVLGGTPASLTAGDYHTCAALTDGTVKCWGRNHSGELGNGVDGTRVFAPPNLTTLTPHATLPVVVTGLTGVAEVSAGDNHTCARLSDGTVKCWGNGQFGQLGQGANTNSKTAVAVSGLTGVTSISSGSAHTCARMSDNTVTCWGLDEYGQMGGTGDSATPVAVPGVAGATSLSAGEYHTCAVSAGKVLCWGRNQYGQLGNNTRDNSVTPVEAFGITNATAVVAGDQHTCAVLTGGDVRCWGKNVRGQLGDGTATASLTPVTVSGYGAAAPAAPPPPPPPTPPQLPVSGTLGITAGQYHTCMYSNGSVRCWGANGFGQLGDGTTITRSQPLTITGFSDFSKVVAGGATNCGLNASGQTLCWGLGAANRFASLSVVDRLSPEILPAIERAKDIGMGYLYHTCIVNETGEIKCWGQAVLGGEVGDGNGDITIEPSNVTGVSNAKSLNASGFHTCAIVQRDTLKCWGDNTLGKIGDGAYTLFETGKPVIPSQRYTPVYVTGLRGVKQVELGQFHTCAVMLAGGVKCWGYNLYGQLGSGTKTFSQTVPVDVVGLTGVTQLTLGVNHSCAILANTKVMCWGQGYNGQLGNSGQQDSAVPVEVAGLTGVVGISAGDKHTCAVMLDGSSACWGSNEFGQLAVPPGQLPQSSVPIDTATGKPATGVDPNFKQWGGKVNLPLAQRSR